MERFPEELIVLICDYCDHASLKNIRLVNSRWSAASTPGTFEHFYMGLFASGASRLEKLARSPALSRHVRRFTIYSDVLPDWNREAWEKAIDDRPPFSEWLSRIKAQASGSITRLDPGSHYGLAEQYEILPRHHLSEDELDRGYLAYRASVRDQVNWRDNLVYLAFKECLGMLENLSEASVQCTTPFAGRTNQWPVWRALRRRILVGPDDWMYSTDLQEANFAYLSGHAALSLLEAVSYRASFSGTKQLSKLHIHSAHLDPYRKLLNDATDSGGGAEPLAVSARAQWLHEGFHHLTRLSLHVPYATISARLHGMMMANETMGFLRSARQIVALDLRFGDDELSPDDDTSQLESLFASDQSLWPNIEHLALATNVPALILLEFLENHSGTLRSLELRDMMVRNVDLALEKLPQVIKLDHIYVEQLWDDARAGDEISFNHLCVLSRGTDFDDPYEQAVKSYMLGRSPTLPPIKRDGGFGDVMDWDDDDPD